MERASVPAFVELARELHAHGAPSWMARAARSAARDEIRHATAIARLASAVGATAAPVERVATTVRSLEEMADDNAVGEAHAALIAAHQASSARSVAVRATYARIARARTRDDVRREAVHALALGAEHDETTHLRTLGIPAPERGVELARALA